MKFKNKLIPALIVSSISLGMLSGCSDERAEIIDEKIPKSVGISDVKKSDSVIKIDNTLYSSKGDLVDSAEYTNASLNPQIPMTAFIYNSFLENIYGKGYKPSKERIEEQANLLINYYPNFTKGMRITYAKQLDKLLYMNDKMLKDYYGYSKDKLAKEDVVYDVAMYEYSTAKYKSDEEDVDEKATAEKSIDLIKNLTEKQFKQAVKNSGKYDGDFVENLTYYEANTNSEIYKILKENKAKEGDVLTLKPDTYTILDSKEKEELDKREIIVKVMKKHTKKLTPHEQTIKFYADAYDKKLRDKDYPIVEVIHFLDKKHDSYQLSYDVYLTLYKESKENTDLLKGNPTTSAYNILSLRTSK